MTDLLTLAFSIVQFDLARYRQTETRHDGVVRYYAVGPSISVTVMPENGLLPAGRQVRAFPRSYRSVEPRHSSGTYACKETRLPTLPEEISL